MNAFLGGSKEENIIVKRFLEELVKNGFGTKIDENTYDMFPFAAVFEPYDNQITIK